MELSSNELKFQNFFANICRVCGKESSYLMSLFEIGSKVLTVAEMISICTKIEIRKIDHRPLNICMQCKRNLDITFDFYNLVEISENKFQEMLSAQNAELSDIIKIESDMNIEPSEIYQEIEPIVFIDDSIKFDQSVDVEEDEESISPNNTNSISFTQQINPKKGRKQYSKQKIAATVNRHLKRRFECFLCKAKFKTIRDARAHLEKHNAATPHICSICSMRFSRNLFEQHLCYGKTIQCDYCPSVFSSTIVLLNHLESHKQQKKLHKCNECPKLFPMEYLMKAHRREHNYMEKPHICDKCGTRFKAMNFLRKHMETHFSLFKSKYSSIFSIYRYDIM